MKKIFSLFAAVLFAGSMMAANLVLFHESFGDNANSARAWSDDYADQSGVAAIYEDATYTVSDAKQSKNTMGQTASALVSSQGKAAVFVVGPLKCATFEALTVTNYFGMSAGSWAESSFMKCSYSVDGTNYTEVTRTGDEPSSAAGKNKNLVQASYSLPAAAQVNTLYLKFEAYCYQKNKNNVEIGQAYIDEVELKGTGEAPVVAVEKPVIAGETPFFGETEVAITCATEGAKIYYTLDGTEPAATSTEYTAAFKLKESATVKAIAIKGEDKSKIAEKTFSNRAFASFDELIAAELPTATLVEVSFEDLVVDSFYVNSQDKRQGVYFAVNEVAYEIYFKTVEVPAAWEAGGKLSGTIRGNWKYYTGGSIWEVEPAATDWTWEQLTYKGSATAIENTEAEVKAVKFYENGQLVIIKNGVKYNIIGAELR